MPRIFISHASRDREWFVDSFAELLRRNYLDTFYSPHDIGAGSWQSKIREEFDRCDWFVVVCSPRALESRGAMGVIAEVREAMANPKFFSLDGRDSPTLCRVVPVVVEDCPWQQMHPSLGHCQALDFTSSEPHRRRHAEKQLLEAFGVDYHEFAPLTIGDIALRVYTFVGGDGETRYRPGDIHCEGPSRKFELPEDVRALANGPEGILARRTRDAADKQQTFVNNPQVRLAGASWGGPKQSGGLDNRPLRLKLDWTEYFHTVATNFAMDARLPGGETIGTKYQSAVDDLAGSRLSNPIAVNLSLVTLEDRRIFVARRGRGNAFNAPEGRRIAYGPAVSGDGQPEDLDEQGVYDPFSTAVREAFEEVTGPYRAKPDEVTLFGLARTMKTRFPFLFGELRLSMSERDLYSMRPPKRWEGELEGIDFTIGGVTEWVLERYQDQLAKRFTTGIDTTLFSLLQSLLYEYPDRWPEVVRRLRRKKN